MPGTWPDGDDDGDEPASARPVHPDDRLWRHPSELAWSAPPGPGGAVDPARSGPRLWAVALVSGLTGAALAVAVVAVVAGVGTPGTEPVLEPTGALEQLADPGSLRPADDLAEMTEAVAPSVVRLEIVDASGETTVASGIVVLDDGHVLSTAHLAGPAGAITIVEPGGSRVPAMVVGTDPATGVTVIRPAEREGAGVRWEPAARGSASDLAIGRAAVAIGAPAGSGGPSVTLAVVSALDQEAAVAGGTVLRGLVETDAPIAAGATGGALCDSEGRVVGMLTDAAGDRPGRSFAVPMEAAWAVAESLIEGGTVPQVWLGIEGSTLDATRVSVLGLTAGAGGAYVERVLPASPAETAGLRAGDVLVAIDGEALATMDDVVAALRAYRPGDEITIDLQRDGAIRSVTVTLGERDS